MSNSNTVFIKIISTLLAGGLFAIAGAILWSELRTELKISNSMQEAPIDTPPPASLNDVPLKSDRQVDYTPLREDLRQHNWRAADRDTYLRLLDAAGPEAQATGMTPQDEMETLSCTDLRTVDQLWSAATQGQQGFTTQMSILRAMGNDYRRMYAKVGWQTLPPSDRWTFEWDYNPQTHRMQFQPGKEPNYTNPPPGHLPTVEIGYNLGVAFSGALQRCRF